MSLSRLAGSSGKGSPSFVAPAYYNNSGLSPPHRKAKAAFIVLARSGDLEGILSSMKELEDRFNKVFQYPWIFLSEEPFSDEFVQCVLSSAFL
jgi:alpha 1,2-mannosyltransferase